jgi:hypothetical protein
MRIGANPLRHKNVASSYKRHRLIIPVYIPEQSGYFEHAVPILRMCLQSAFATIDPGQVSITVINNASVDGVDEILSAAYRDGRIDRYIRNRVNRGKPDAIAGEILASYETFVTVADSDVLFLPGWLQAVERVFVAFPSAGSVSPFPAPTLHFYHTANAWLQALARGSIRLSREAGSEDLRDFAVSVGHPDMFDERDYAFQYSTQRAGQRALIGGGHFAVCMRRRAFDGFLYEPIFRGTGAGEPIMDARIDQAGYLRLSTSGAWVRHMGNTPQPWMTELMAKAMDAAPAAALDDPALDDRGDTRGWFLRHAPLALRKLAALPVMYLARQYRRHRRLPSAVAGASPDRQTPDPSR